MVARPSTLTGAEGANASNISSSSPHADPTAQKLSRWSPSAAFLGLPGERQPRAAREEDRSPARHSSANQRLPRGKRAEATGKGCKLTARGWQARRPWAGPAPARGTKRSQVHLIWPLNL